MSLSLCVVHSSCSHDLLTHQLWHSRQASQTPGALWRRAGGSLSLYERRWVPMWPPHFFTAVCGRRVAFGYVATFVLGYKSHSVAGLSTLTPSQSFSVPLTPPTPPFPPLSLLLWVSYGGEESSLLTAEIRRCVNENTMNRARLGCTPLHFALTQSIDSNPWNLHKCNSLRKSKQFLYNSWEAKRSTFSVELYSAKCQLKRDLVLLLK